MDSCVGESEPNLPASDGWEVDLGARELRADGAAIPIGGRAFEIVEILVRAAGELVSKDEVMRHVWPGTNVEDNTIEVHISAIRKALGSDRKMLKTVTGRGYRLLGDWRIRHPVKQDLSRETRSGPASFLTNIPVAVSPLVGRETVVPHVEELLAAYRAVTLTGPGGIGKTVLASEVARGLFPKFGGDVIFVDLVSLSAPALVPSAVAGALGLQIGGEISSASVARAIGGKKLLLVLDNCEHVVDAAAAMVEILLRSCPGTTVLSTSREILRIEGEHVYAVPPLEAPDGDHADPEHVLSHSAVKLFIARMTSLGLKTSPHGDDLFAIARICRRLDGIPLAIELAAARTTTFGIQELAARLDGLLDLLRGGRRTALPRHQTLRAMLDWSYELLSRDEQRLIRHLAVFPAGFTLAAAAALVHDGGAFAPGMEEDGISSLVSKSLIAADGAAPDGRWRLLETTRAYALEKLVELGEAAGARRRHAQFFRDLIGSMAPTPFLRSGTSGLEYCLREIDNTRAALDWAFSPDGDTEIGIALTAAHAPVWLGAAMLVECRDRVERALQCPDVTANPLLHVQLLIALGSALIVTLGSADRSKQLLSEAAQAAEAVGNTDAQLLALRGLWSLYINTGGDRATLEFAERFFALATKTGDEAILPVAHRILGCSLHFVGNQTDARRHLERVFELSDRSGPGYGSWFLYDQDVTARTELARVLLLQGFPEQALAASQRSLADAFATSNKLTLCLVLALSVIFIADLTGEGDAAARAQIMLTETATRYNLQQFVRQGRRYEARILISRRQFAEGVFLLKEELKNDENGRGGPFFAILARGLSELGQFEEAQIAIDRALASADLCQTWSLAEFHRTKGELFVRQGGKSFPLAEVQFRNALDIAGQQGALFWELRAAASLFRLLQKQNRADDGRAVLAPVYKRFNEGFQTADMIEARELLN
jgi:predicted ATPase/DNA-binding winged helix-turn-helix (wHTH) protein